jgi:hypothetical protein
MSNAIDTTNKENMDNSLSNGVESVVSKKNERKKKVEAKYYAGLPSTINHDGYPFTHKKVSVKEDTALYWCRHARSPNNCEAKIKIQLPSGCVCVINDVHSQKCVAKLLKVVAYAEAEVNTCIVADEYMKGRAEELAVEHMAMTGPKIWKALEKEVTEKYPVWSGLSNMQVQAIVKNVRAREYGFDMFVKLETNKVSRMKDNDKWFLQFNALVTDPKDGQRSRMLGFANPKLIGLLNGDVQIYIDGTFKICPKPFYQCLIIMVFNEQTDSYVPIFYILLQGKTTFEYNMALHFVCVATNWKLQPSTVICDFEKGLHAAVRHTFQKCRNKVNG